MGANADIIEHAFGTVIPVCERRFSTTLDVQIEIDGDECVTRPTWVGRSVSVSD
jgi:hypothetical protein